MNLGVITRQGPEFHPNLRLSQAAAQRGHQVYWLNPYRQYCALKGGRPTTAGRLAHPALDAVLPRQGATLGRYCLDLIGHYELMGIPMINRLNAVRLASNKFMTLQALSAAGLPAPDTWLVAREEGFSLAVEDLGGYPVVVKAVSGFQGEGVALVSDAAAAEKVLAQFLDRRRGLLVQGFIPPRGRRDLRVLVLGGKVAGAMMLRPKRNDFRANYHLSQDARPVELAPEWGEMACEAAGALGLEIAGVDILVGRNSPAKVIEVNYSPGFKGLEAATGLDIAGKIIEHVESVCRWHADPSGQKA